jgi:two-component system, LytTR family, response regulator
MPAVVFVTAHDRFAVRAFEAHALDYLVKPLNVERFEAALERVRERMRLREAAGLASKLTALLAAERAERERKGIERLVVSTPAGEVVIPAAEIDWIGADDYYASVHAGAKSYLLREPLSSLERGSIRCASRACIARPSCSSTGCESCARTRRSCATGRAFR